MVPGDAKEPSEFLVDLPSPRSVDSRSEASDRPRSVDSRVEGDRAVQSERPSATWRERRPRPTTEPLDRDLRAEPATLRLTLEPADAVVYLDGRLLGSGEELDMLHSSLLIDPGSHELEAVRPGYETRVIDFDAKAGREIELEIELERR